MATLKAKELKSISKEERERKLKELKFELVKSKASASKAGNSRTKEIKKIIARILTLNK
ncbi:MAG TPA: 50S ribosomal protein L29 [Ignavibacteriaceae bacterium]|jgi:ribosomal protein L29